MLADEWLTHIVDDPFRWDDRAKNGELITNPARDADTTTAANIIPHL